MQIFNIEFNNFRSIDEEGLQLDDLKKYNLFIGKNNSGKSNIIKIIPFLGDLIAQIENVQNSFNPSVNNSLAKMTDLFYNGKDNAFLSVTFLITDKEKEDFVSGIPKDSHFHAELFNKPENKITLKFNLHPNSNGTAIDYQLLNFVWADVFLLDYPNKSIRKNDGDIDQTNFDQAYSSLNNVAHFNYISRMLSQLASLSTRFRIIKAVRKIGSSSNGDNGGTRSRMLNQLGIDGTETINTISGWMTPKDDHPINRQKYRTIKKLISDLLIEDVDLVPSDDQLNIEETNGRIMSYKSWGSSLEELLVLVVSIFSSPKESIIALEEPEIHLDPFMQRRLMDFLMKTDHQYFISSHSNVLINSFATDSSTMFRVYKKDSSTKCIEASGVELQGVLDDLGILASDILQCNGIIWVEGPSDRIFIKKWIELKKPDLKEGIHFSIMFYGGKLLSHLTADVTETEEDATTEDFIKLVKLNRNVAVIMDSDKESEDDLIGKTKLRIDSEISKNSNHAFSWITDGREIENYIPAEMFERILKIKGMNNYTKVSDLEKNYIKTKDAEKLVDEMTNEIFKNELLDKRLDDLVLKITSWNTKS